MDAPEFWPNEACRCPLASDECKTALAGSCDPKRCGLSLLYESPTRCAGCEEFLDVKFDADHDSSFDGICLWDHEAIPHAERGHASCPRHKRELHSPAAEGAEAGGEDGE